MDEFHLKRFIDAQEYSYVTALEEIKKGRKMTHWIWYIFPQLKGLGHSSNAQYYGISGLEEAKAYLKEPTLRARLLEISEALLTLDCCDARVVMGRPDDMKLRSPMTLFAQAEDESDIFLKVLEKYFHGQKDKRTLAILDGEKRK